MKFNEAQKYREEIDIDGRVIYFFYGNEGWDDHYRNDLINHYTKTLHRLGGPAVLRRPFLEDSFFIHGECIRADEHSKEVAKILAREQSIQKDPELRTLYEI